MPEFVIFDIDGTLVDSVDLHAKAWQVVFERYGKRISVEQIREQIGKGADQLLPVFWSEKELDDIGKQMKDERSKLFLDEFMPRVKAFPRVRELFKRLRADGKTIALASSAQEDELEELKRIADIEGLADEETNSDDVERSKPHADIFQAVLDRLGNPDVDRAIAIGDTPYDAEAAAKTGLSTVGVLCGGWPVDKLRAAGCVAIYRDPADLLANYERSPLAG